MSAFNTDCLVLKIEEVETETGKLDNTMFLIYDKRNHTYLIRGGRRQTSIVQCCAYSFECEFAEHLADFVQYCVCPDNVVNEILYNYDNLPNNPDDITFDFLCDCESSEYEISGYNHQPLTRERILRNARMLRNVFNYY